MGCLYRTSKRVDESLLNFEVTMPRGLCVSISTKAEQKVDYKVCLLSKNSSSQVLM